MAMVLGVGTAHAAKEPPPPEPTGIPVNSCNVCTGLYPWWVCAIYCGW